MLQQMSRRHDHSRSAVSALETVLFPKSLLHRMKLAVFGETLDRCDLGAIGLNCENRGCLHGLTIEMDGACAAHRGLASDVGASELRDLAQIMDQQHARLDFILEVLSV